MDPVFRGLDRLQELFVIQPEQRALWVAVAALALAGGWLLGRAFGSGRSPQVVRRFAAFVLSVTRGVLLVVGGLLVASFFPAWLAPALLLTVAAAAAALGWSLRDILPDLVAGAWLLVERRIRPGVAVVSPEPAGLVERMGLRAVSIRTASGHLVLVPNRKLLEGTYRLESSRWAVIRVELSVPQGLRAAEVRRALQDAVLSSPDVPAEPDVRVDQDPVLPRRWRIQTRLVDSQRAPKFEGELQARLQAFLRVHAPSRSGAGLNG